MKTLKPQLLKGSVRILSLLLLLIIVFSCEGPRGPRGSDGIDGDVFAYSAIYDIDPSEWDGDFDGYSVFLDVLEITDDIYYDGAVLVYRLIETEPKSFNSVPYTYVNNGFMVYLDFDAYVGGIQMIYREVLDGVNDTFAPEDLMSFKIVIIEGIPLATVKSMVDINDFDAVTKTFNVVVKEAGGIKMQ
jgi:hypothetical protein